MHKECECDGTCVRTMVHEGGSGGRTLMLQNKKRNSVDALLYMPALSLPRARSEKAATLEARVGRKGEGGAGTGAGETGVRMREEQVVRKRTRRSGSRAGEGGSGEGGEGVGLEGGEGGGGEGGDVDGDVMLKEEKSFVLSGCPDGIIRVWEVLFPREMSRPVKACSPRPSFPKAVLS
jgi:hypothetical protein